MVDDAAKASSTDLLVPDTDGMSFTGFTDAEVAGQNKLRRLLLICMHMSIQQLVLHIHIRLEEGIV